MTTPTVNRPRIKLNTNVNQHLEEIKHSDLSAVLEKVRNNTIKENPKDILEQAFKATGQTMSIKPAEENEAKIMRQFPPPVNNDSIDLPESKTPVENTILPNVNYRLDTVNTEELGEHAERTGLPSNSVFYDFDDIAIRPFSVPDFGKLYVANSKKADSMIIDVINNTTNCDVWDLTEKDFRYIMYWLRLNSYLRNPYTLNWTSFYGNRNTITISKSNLDIKQLDANKTQYQKWVDRGFCMPTMRDLQEYMIVSKRLDLDDQYIWTRAKYLKGNNVQEKLDHAKSIAPDEFFVDVQEFVKIFEDYGVKESVAAIDQHFEANAALIKMQEIIDRNTIIINNQNVTDDIVEEALARIATYNDEINRIKMQLQTSGEAAPVRETVTFKINVTDFFPLLFNSRFDS